MGNDDRESLFRNDGFRWLRCGRVALGDGRDHKWHNLVLDQQVCVCDRRQLCCCRAWYCNRHLHNSRNFKRVYGRQRSDLRLANSLDAQDGFLCPGYRPFLCCRQHRVGGASGGFAGYHFFSLCHPAVSHVSE